jgi:arylsulfatase A-like enzyme
MTFIRGEPSRAVLFAFRCLIAPLVLLPSSIAAQGPRPADPSGRPNVIVFFMDDLGYGDLRSYGATDVRTPNLDRLGREGVRLTDCYAAAPLCTPTRAAFMTGAYQHRVGLEAVLTPRNDQLGLSASVPTLPRLLKEAGYATGLVGKWHLGWKPEFHPNRHGFDEFFGFLSGSVDYYSHRNSAGVHDLYENDQPVQLTTYLTDEITARAIAFIERHASRPFFLDVAYNATHWPFQPPDLTTPPSLPSGTYEEVTERWAAHGTREEYVRMLERADEGIGRILAALERAGLGDRTLVIFTSDNGGEWLSRMEPFFNRKGTLWEGGLRVPCILRWPGRLPAGTVSSQAAITMDLTATILAAAQVSASPDLPLDGIDLVPLLAGQRPPIDRTFHWLSPFAGNPDRAIRYGHWKYISESALFPGLLFDLQADPGERNDLAAERPELLEKLRGMHRDWERSVRTPPASSTPSTP